MITSSPGSMKAMKALSIPWTYQQPNIKGKEERLISPSFAPVVIVTSVSGSNLRPQYGAYASEIAFFSRGLPLVGLYWLQSTRLRASLAALMMKGGGL